MTGFPCLKLYKTSALQVEGKQLTRTSTTLITQQQQKTGAGEAGELSEPRTPLRVQDGAAAVQKIHHRMAV